MGTSSSDPGPKGRNPLLPPWAEVSPIAPEDAGPKEASSETEVETNPFAPTLSDPGEVLSWVSPRVLIGKATRVSSPSERREYIRRAVRGSVQALGGGASAARGAIAGRSTAAKFGYFLASLANRGLSEAAREFGVLEYLGRGADIFLARLADTLAPAGALTEDAIARAALNTTLEELLDQLDLAHAGIDTLESMTPEMMADAMVRYVANYVYERVLQALASHIETTSPNPARVREVERDVKRYIDDIARADVAPMLGKGADFGSKWDRASAQQTADRLFVESFRVVIAGLGGSGFRGETR